MATHSSILAWRIPWIEELDGLQSVGLQRVAHDSVINTFTGLIHVKVLEKLVPGTYLVETQRRQLHPTPILLPGKSHGWRSLVGCSPWGLEESDTAE